LISSTRSCGSPGSGREPTTRFIHSMFSCMRYTAAEWPAVVSRMQENMEWMNRVVGSRPLPGEPQLRVEEINAFLRKHARP
jgi:hypothetical protein